MSYEGVLDFYLSRINAAPRYGLKAGHELLHLILRCAMSDDMLTREDFSSIIKSAEEAHIKILEEDFNEGFK